MPKTITLDPLSPSSVANAIAELQSYKQWVEQKTQQLAEALSEIGIYEASFRFAGAQYDGSNDVRVKTVQGSPNTYEIVAEGKAVAFIEFGAGVYFNTAGYPLAKPPGIVGIGEYGDGRGKQQGWVYPEWKGVGSNGWVIKSGKVFTRGNPAAMPMYYASQEMQRTLEAVAREVFSS